MDVFLPGGVHSTEWLLTWRCTLYRLDDGLGYAHLLYTNIWWVKQYFWYAEPLIVQSNYLQDKYHNDLDTRILIWLYFCFC